MKSLKIKQVPVVPYIALSLVGTGGGKGQRGTPKPLLVGVPGSKGTQGKTGKQGAKGDQGDHGKRGPMGNDGASIKGQQGIPGPKGDTGPQGETGPAPKHKWTGTAIQFMQPTGEWGKQVNLKGDRGPRGEGTQIGWNTYQIINGGGGVDDVQYDTNINVVSDIEMYKGEADPGSSTASPVWRVAKFITNDEGDLVKTWEAGSANFNKVWDQYASR